MDSSEFSKSFECRKKMSQEKGIALILVIQLGLAIFLLQSAWLISLQGKNHLFDQQRDRIKAYYTAESGLNKAVWRLKRNPYWRTSNSRNKDRVITEKLFTTGTGKCLLSVEDYGSGAIITATGYAGKSSKTLHALMGIRMDGSIYFVYTKPMRKVIDE
jgi:hypothetical protein